MTPCLIPSYRFLVFASSSASHPFFHSLSPSDYLHYTILYSVFIYLSQLCKRWFKQLLPRALLCGCSALLLALTWVLEGALVLPAYPPLSLSLSLSACRSRSVERQAKQSPMYSRTLPSSHLTSIYTPTLPLPARSLTPTLCPLPLACPPLYLLLTGFRRLHVHQPLEACVLRTVPRLGQVPFFSLLAPFTALVPYSPSPPPLPLPHTSSPLLLHALPHQITRFLFSFFFFFSLSSFCAVPFI